MPQINVRLLTLIILLAACYGEGAQDTRPTGNVQSDAARDAQTKFYFRMTDGDRKAFLKKIQTIRAGDARQDVLALLGKPWDDYPVATKKGKFIFRRVTYYLAKYQKDLVNERLDESVMFEFSQDDRLLRIVSEGLGETQQLPNPRNGSITK